LGVSGPIKPFLITVPLPANLDEWENARDILEGVLADSERGDNELYDIFMDTMGLPLWRDKVYAYPKNEFLQIEVSVNDDDAITIGDTVTWTIKATFPEVFQGDYRIEHTLDPRLAVFMGNDDIPSITVELCVSEVDCREVGSGWPDLNAKYQLDGPQHHPFGTKWTVTFTQQQLEAFEDFGISFIKITIETENIEILQYLPDGPKKLYAGELSNFAALFMGWDPDPVGSAFDTTCFGDVQFRNVDQLSHKGLTGGKFELWRDDFLIDTFDAGEDGLSDEYYLKCGNYEIVQTQTPDGYLGPDEGDEPISWTVEVKANEAGRNCNASGNMGESPFIDCEGLLQEILLPNSRAFGWDLPLSGGLGTALYIVVGIGLLGGAVVVTRSVMRKEQAA
ncbi:MAG: SpaA isopeptide-forming pilin-related protein, partial [Promicromonosporaceae bacterium]|nr:SpaA isopeptide-forming pilin-related protein [Promicromonosporaceae bacterium]